MCCGFSKPNEKLNNKGRQNTKSKSVPRKCCRICGPAQTRKHLRKREKNVMKKSTFRHTIKRWHAHTYTDKICHISKQTSISIFITSFLRLLCFAPFKIKKEYCQKLKYNSFLSRSKLFAGCLESVTFYPCSFGSFHAAKGNNQEK